MTERRILEAVSRKTGSRTKLPRSVGVGKNSSFKFINPKCKVHRCVLGVSSAGSCVLSTGINWGGSSQAKIKEKDKNEN